LETAKKRILIIDDEADITYTLKRGIEKADKRFEIDTFTDPEEALKKIQSTGASEYDLLLVDFKMPKMDGISFYRKAREVIGRSHAKVCFITAMDSMEEELKQLATELKNIDYPYIKKPVSIQELNEKIQSILY
jgi:two-component system response regulator RpfG